MAKLKDTKQFSIHENPARVFALSMSQGVLADIPINYPVLEQELPRLYARLYEKMLPLGQERVDLLMSDEKEIRKLLLSLYSEKSFKLFYAVQQKGVLDFNSIENIMLFHSYQSQTLSEGEKPMLDAITSLLFLRALKSEIASIKRVVNKDGMGIDASKASVTATMTEWTKCPAIFRGYMRNFSLVGHPRHKKNVYAFDAGDYVSIALISYLKNCSDSVAEQFLQENKNVLAHFIPFEMENFFLKRLLTTPTPVLRAGFLNGSMYEDLETYEMSETSLSSNLYNNEIQRRLLEHTGAILYALSADVYSRGLVDEVDVYYITERGFAFTTDKELSELVSPELQAKFKKITGISLKYEGKLI